MSAPLTGSIRCPSCGASIRAGAPWCTLCYADLRPPPPDPPAEAVPPAAVAASPPLGRHAAPLGETGGPVAAPPGGVAGGGGEPTWPCGACGASNPIELDSCAACGTRFLGALSLGEAPLLALPGVGDVSRLSRAQRIGLSVGVTLAFLLLVALLSLLSS